MYKKVWKNIAEKLHSERFYLIVIYIVTVVAMTAILTSKHYLFQSIIDNGISKRNIIATKKIEVVDVEKTNQRKREMARRVEPILTPLHDEHVINNYKNLVSAIELIRSKHGSLLDTKREVLKVVDITDKQDDAIVNFIIRTPDASFQKISDFGLKTLSKSLDMGVSEQNINEDIDKFILANTSSVLSRQQAAAVCFLVKQIILPNMIVDEMATEVAKQNAMNAVEPVVVTFNKGEQIVFQGEFVSRLKKDALKKAGYTVSELNFSGVIGLLSLILMVSYCLYFYLKNLEDRYRSLPYVSLISLLSIFMTVISISLPADMSVYIMPFAAYTIIVAIFVNPRIAFLSSILLLIIIGIALGYSIDVVTTFTMSIMMATFAVGKLNFLRRMDLAQVGIFVCAVQMYIIFAVYMMNSNLYSASFMSDITAGIISGLFSGVIALGLIPLLEGMFKIITPYGLSELADHNQGLLKRLQFEAPGTYHHSLMVSNLAEAAAEAVGANPILARVGSFYHDIGKLKRPLFFVENQSYFSIENPHEKLNPRLSKMIITAHPKDGIELAKEYGLPAVIHKFILQHHGNSVASYFYNQAKQQEGEDVKKEQFRYTCPKPNMKETAILMLADAAESAVRTLNEPTQEEMEQTIEKIIQDRLIDGQLSDSPLTQKDLKTVAQTFVRVLKGMQHHRIKYQDNMNTMMQELQDKVQQMQKPKEADGQEADNRNIVQINPENLHDNDKHE